jgi:hypothetical protein
MTLAKMNGAVNNSRAVDSRLWNGRQVSPANLSELVPFQQALRFLRALVVGWLIEIRLLECPRKFGPPFRSSGYFDDLKLAADKVVDADEKYRPGGSYVTLNPVRPDVLARSANELKEFPKCATRDDEILRRRRIVIDLDPVRPAGISSTVDQLAAAMDLGQRVRTVLRDEYLWPVPIVEIMSGNGVQMLYDVDLPNDEHATELVKKVLAGLAMLFDSDAVKVDQSVANASQVVKIAGTTARKGSHTKDRPHRLAELLFVTDKPEQVSHERLEAVAALATETNAATATFRVKSTETDSAKRNADLTESLAPGSRRLIVPKYLEHYGRKCTELTGTDGKGRKRFAIECPFNPQHEGRDAAILQSPNGKLAFHCFHDSCHDKGWRDVRRQIGRPLAEHYDQGPQGGLLTNFTMVDGGENDQPAAVAGRDGRDVVVELTNLTGGLPKRLGDRLFVPDGDRRPLFLESADALFAWMHAVGIRTSWRQGPGLVTRLEFFHQLRQGAEQFWAVEFLPHEPRIPGVYYLAKSPRDGDGSCLDELVDFFFPATAVDRDLIRAFVLTLFWGGRPGKRPMFVVVGPENDGHRAGRGTGKSSLVQILSDLVSGYLDISAKESIDEIKKRLLSAEAQGLRLCLMDNVKSLRFSCAEIEALITSPVISGRRLYGGETQRPNTFVFAVTINAAAFSKDLAERSIVIRLGRPTHDPRWESNVRRFIQENRAEIVADVLATLRVRGGAR